MGAQDLQQARYDQLLRRVGGLYGGGSKVVEVLPELFPVIEVENTTPELLLLNGWRLAWQNIEETSPLAETAAVSITNPVGSGILAAVEELDLRTSFDDNIQILVTNTLDTSPEIRGLFRDARLGGNRNTACELRNFSNVPTGAGLRIRLVADEVMHLAPRNGICVLSPGTALQIGTTGTQLQLAVNCYWRERVAQSSELLFP